MTWKQSLKLKPLNELFAQTGITFSSDEVEGGYIATWGERLLRRPSLMKCAKAVLKEWFNPR